MGLQDRSVVAEKGCTRVFVGTFEHGLDEKGRLILPSAFRDAFATGGYLTKSLEGCLALMGEAEFQAQYEHRMRLASAGRVARNAARAFMAGSVPIVPDKQGRIAIPAKLREFADLDRTCVRVQTGDIGNTCVRPFHATRSGHVSGVYIPSARLAAPR